MVNLDDDGAVCLAAAVARQWIRDLPGEVPVVADWLGLEPDELRRRLNPKPRRPPNGWSATAVCRGCGAPLPERSGPGRQRLWCSEACRWRAYRARLHNRGSYANT